MSIKFLEIGDNCDELARTNKVRENFRRKSLSTWKPARSQDARFIQGQVEHSDLAVYLRLSQNQALGRNKGHHQQQEFNRKHVLIPV